MCKMTKVYFTELAYLQLLVEVKKYTLVETGAILVGRVVDNDFYVYESLDSGMNCRRSSSIFYRDNPYSEHLVDVVRAKYNGAVAIGFWHRHPGNFNQFSYDDLDANIDMARVLGRNIISGLVNIFNGKVHLKFWKITLNNKYEDTEIIVNDNAFRGILEFKDIHSVEKKIIENELGERQGFHLQRSVSMPVSSTANLISQPNIGAQHQEPKLFNEIVQQDKKPKKFWLCRLIRKKKNQTSEDGQIQNQATQQNPVNQASVVRNAPQIKTEEGVESRILSTITLSIEILQNRHHIYCAKWRKPEGTEFRDKLAFNFKNVTNGKNSNVMFYYKGATLFYYLEVTKQEAIFERTEFISNIVKYLEDNNGNRYF